ncbi:MAG: lysoplasmalogenase [Flavobacteriales bacterium]|nr:lysoplasmalogenase [Flavobacteriales bacterium]
MGITKNTALNIGLYGAACLGTITGEMIGSHALVYVCKPLMLIVLSSWFFFNSRRVGDRFTLLIQAGLFFSLVGDVALMFQHIDQFNFLIGLAAFLVAQLCYSIGFIHNIVDGGPSRSDLISAIIAVGLAAYGYFFADMLLPKVGDGIAIPIGVYAGAICLMGAAAAFRLGRTYMRSYIMVLVGALLFITSDSLLAINRFLEPMESARWTVTLTYGAAQLLIAWGALVHVLDPDEIRRRAALST